MALIPIMLKSNALNTDSVRERKGKRLSEQCEEIVRERRE